MKPGSLDPETVAGDLQPSPHGPWRLGGTSARIVTVPDIRAYLVHEPEWQHRQPVHGVTSGMLANP